MYSDYFSLLGPFRSHDLSPGLGHDFSQRVPDLMSYETQAGFRVNPLR